MKITEGGELKTLGQRLRFWRKRRGMKATQFAEAINLSQGSLSAIETGKSLPSAQTIIWLMELEGMDIYWLLTGKHDARDIILKLSFSGGVDPNTQMELIKTLIGNLKMAVAVNQELGTNLNELNNIIES